jgi:hypothetical protein
MFDNRSIYSKILENFDLRITARHRRTVGKSQPFIALEVPRPILPYTSVSFPVTER